jgi:hypothetical protein
MPEAMISDRDPKFTSDFWKSLHKILGVKLAFSMALHAQTDGLAERSIGTLEESLCLFCALEDLKDRDGLHLDWYNLIPLFEFAYNSSVHATTKQIPFEVDLGQILNNPLPSIGNSLPGLLGINRAA